MKHVLAMLVTMAAMPWTMLMAVNWHGCAIRPGSQEVWVVSDPDSEAQVYCSPDFGQHWESRTPLTNYGFYDIFFQDSMTGWTCGHAAEVWRTTDGGANWDWIGFGVAKAFTRIRFADVRHGWAAGFGAMAGRWNDSTQEWKQKLLPVHPDSGDLQGVSLVDSEYGWMCTGHDSTLHAGYVNVGHIVKTSNGGASWSCLVGDTLHDYFDICFLDRDSGIVVGGNQKTGQGWIGRSTDGGQTWSGWITAGGVLRSVWFCDARHGWAVGKYGTILHSTDGGRNWSLQSSGIDTILYDVKFRDTLTGVTSGANAILLTTDGGVTWVRSNLGVCEPDDAGPAAGFLQTPTVACGTLWLGKPPCDLLDISGRTVLRISESSLGNRHSVDVSHLAPGVYFVREQIAGSSEQSATRSLRKVILTR